MKCLTCFGWSLTLLFLVTSATRAEEPRRGAKPSDGQRAAGEATQRGERKPADGAPRGERPAGSERRGGASDGGRRSEFPAEIKLSDEQQTKLNELRGKFDASFAELAKQRDAVLSDEQKSAGREAEKKIREGGLSRQEVADLMSAALKLTSDQKTKIEAIEQEATKLRANADTQKLAVLTDEQRTTLRKLAAARALERAFALPGDITLTDAQKSSLKALHDELGSELASLTEKRDSILTEERRVARDAVYKEARESNKDRQALADALNAALNMTDSERAELAETEQKLRELQEKIQDRKLGLLTAEQKQEFEKKYGSGRGRG